MSFMRSSILFALVVMCLFVHVSPASLERYNYDARYKNISTIRKQPHAVMVIAFNRPQYLKQVIASLERNPESQTLPFYFFLDGGPRAKQQENSALINASSIKHTTIIARDRNYGCAKNHIDAKRFMFDWCGYEKVVVLEEDLVVSPSFIHLNLKLHTWARERFSNVGVVQGWSYCYLNKEEKQKRLNLVGGSGKKWWSFVGYCLDRDVWNDMRSILYTYESFVDRIPLTESYDYQRSKPSASPLALDICAWAKTLFDQYTPKPNLTNKESFPTQAITFINDHFLLDTFLPNQDMMMGFALVMAGYVKMRTVVNRAHHIGKEGITCAKLTFDRVFRNMKLDDFSQQDFALDDFVVAHQEPDTD